jgi:hypothetical protein
MADYMSIYSDDMYFDCHVCGGSGEVLEVSLEEPRYSTTHRNIADDLCDHVSFSIEVPWRNMPWSHRIKAAWYALRGKRWNFSEVCLENAQVAVLYNRLRYWSTLREWDWSQCTLPKGVSGATKDCWGNLE